MKISVNCPSYKRPKVETLDYLPFCKVWVCETEYEEYIKNNPKENIVAVPKGVQGNVGRIRNYILDQEFAAGVDVVVIVDDDLNGIYRYEKAADSDFGYEQVLVDANEFMSFIEHYSLLCDEWGYKLWGVNVNSDAKAYRHMAPFSTVSVVLGPFSVHLNNLIRYDERLPLKEDYDLALQHLNKYRGVLRVNKYHYSCKQSEQAGGCAAYRNYAREKEQFELLQQKWGDKIVKQDKASVKKFDYNPIIHIPIKGI